LRGKIPSSLSGRKAYLNIELKDRDCWRLLIKLAVMPGHDIADRLSTSRFGALPGACGAEKTIHRVAAEKRI
jgi:hypothetical protein